MSSVNVLRRVPPVWWFVLAFFLMCCAYESGRVLHLRPQPHHLWRQTDCIALAWNYYDTTANLFEPAIHNQFADDFTDGKTAGEFPILYWLVGMLWRITGPSEFTYRLIELLLHFAGTLALFASLRRIVGDAFWAGCAALLFYASPVLVYFGISFLTDVPAFDLALIGWWHMTRYAQDRGLKRWIQAVFFFTLGMSIKVTAGMSLVAITGVLAFSTLLRARLKGRWSPFDGNWKEWAVLAAGYLLVYAWYAYAAAYNNTHGAKYTFNDLWPIWTLTAQEREWAWTIGCDIVVFQVFDTSVWILMAVAFAALAANVRRLPWQVTLLVVTLLLGSVLYTLLWFAALNNHDYYFINPMIALVVLLACFLWLLARHYPDLLCARWSRWAMAALLVLNVAYTAQNMAMRYDTSGNMSARKLWPLYHDQELSY
ncbi:MAG: glycosyltransferase family 39 protein, partial [Flavobacteriales bacterium]|nr:glycosyltransferase family 39 protein [Flavobacteriales bacterium]